MDITLTNTGAIPLDDFPENQRFLVVSGINSIGRGAYFLFRTNQ